MNKIWGITIPLALSVAALASGCGKSGEPQTAGKSDTADAPAPVKETAQPVTLTFSIAAAGFSEEEFTKHLVGPVKKKYPEITLKYINASNKGFTIQDLVAAKQIPDFYGQQQGNFAPLVDLGLTNDIAPLIKKYNFDTNAIQPELLDGIKQQIGISVLPGLPIFQSTWGLAYNKTLFDKFGVAYPKDGMTWDEVVDLSQKLTRTDSGVQYYGISMDRTYYDRYKQVGLAFADFTSNKSLFNSDGWKKQFEYAVDLFRKDGSPPKGTDWNKAWNEGLVAMRTASTSTFQSLLANKDMSWDVVTYPQAKEAMGVGMEMNAHWWMITKQSANQDAAFKALGVALSNDVQTSLSRSLRIPVLKDTAIQAQAGVDVPGTQGKNVVAYTKLKNPKPLMYGTIVSQFAKIWQDEVNTVFYDGKDINSAQREADELLNKAIQESLAK
ncbi:MAG: transporter substrate-binding protein [Paenibacillus sp.]|nr:transporter substrate-binding protein [Paenibacillus sp.]